VAAAEEENKEHEDYVEGGESVDLLQERDPDVIF
jgi:hypothetical protein